MQEEKKPFFCDCGNNKDVIGKTKVGKFTSFNIMWAKIKRLQMQLGQASLLPGTMKKAIKRKGGEKLMLTAAAFKIFQLRS